MITRENLTKVSSESFYENHLREIVEYGGKYYILGHVNAPVDDEEFIDWASKIGEYGIMYLLGVVPSNETWVMLAKWDEDEMEYIPANECGPQCETGVCNKRISSNTSVGSQDLAYSMLITHLNA